MTRKFKQIEIGKIPEDWENKSLGDCIEFVYGEGLPKRKRTDGNIPVYGSNGQIDWHNASLVNGPGIIIGRKGSVGEVTFSKRDFWPIDTTYYVKTKSDNDLLFWFYFLKTLNLPQMNSHSAVPGLNRELVYEILRSIPPLPTQRAIAKILSDLDEKIELNRQMNKTLESIAQAIFKHWFVDFEFPVDLQNHSSSSHFLSHWERKEVRGVSSMKGYKSSGGKMAESELGEIPGGWGLGKFDEIISLNADTINPQEYQDEVFDYYSIPAYDEGQKSKMEPGIEIKSNKHLIPPNAILLSKLNPRIPRVWWPNLKETYRAICSTEFIVTTPRANATREYVYCLFSSPQFKNVFSNLVTGTSGSHQRVKPKYLLELDAIIPSTEVSKRFGGCTKSLFNTIMKNINEIDTLASIRDSLLPKLMSGKIRVGGDQ